MGKLWDIVKEIIKQEEEILRRAILETQRRVEAITQIPVEAGKVVDISDQTFTKDYELELKGIGYVPVIILKTTSKDYTITIVTEQGDIYRDKDFDSFSAISLGNAYVDAQDRTSTEGYYFLALKEIKFRSYFYFLLRPTTGSLYVKNLYILYYLIKKVEV
ncbi:hypothetical protein DRN63_04085 [Nanoarchaeota archaeon]|nr:MAG: hypothetical protein DRN63_04085 [Nanoarchaeota archaeon]